MLVTKSRDIMKEGNPLPDNAHHEILVKQETIDHIAKCIKNLVVRNGINHFRIGEPNNSTTLSIMNIPIAPWRHKAMREGLRIGKNQRIGIVTRRPVFDGKEMVIEKDVTWFDLQTSVGKPPILTVDVSQTESDGLKIWKQPTKEQAQTLLGFINTLNKDHTVFDPLGSTQSEKKEKQKQKKALAKHVKRILKAAGDSIIKDDFGEAITLSHFPHFIDIARKYDTNTLVIQIPQLTNGRKNARQISEIYISQLNLPIEHYTQFDNDLKNTTERKPADQEQLKYLFAVLEGLTDDVVKKELSERKIIRQTVNKILDKYGALEEPDLEDEEDFEDQGEVKSAMFDRKQFIVYINADQNSDDILIYMQNKVDETNDPQDISSYTFSLYQNRPLEVHEVRYEEESDFEDISCYPAKSDQKDFLLTLLDVLNKPSETY